ncbi:T9SS type A sorting domain-containing protein [Flavobacterium nackdongense]|uniref:T9SS type A sorting domain-containing protein n=1 Tax=Flavobacterium nackdongense TaxID=2547394 RepID=A0A4P6YI67_9FLAO|nr:T9SS type A sorting domain-containing protein [Flavobacterium nackdongense]QBN20163.1 T9SS type A sorting domain-containing protein [Flavobacterium nackdongense]
MNNKYRHLLIVFLFGGTIIAQTTETFETETDNNTSFTDNSLVFSITSLAGGIFDIGNFTGTGWNGTAADNKYIDNSGTADIGIPVQFKIKSPVSTSFKLKSFYLFLSQSNLNAGSGSCTITGKLAGSTVFTATASTGFNSNPLVNNGFTFINLTTYGGTDNSNKSIDEFTITTTGTFEYVALDAMTWTNNALSVDQFDAAAFNYYPNPVKNTLNLRYSKEITSAKISNMLGQTISEKMINAKETEIEMSTLSKGTYILEIKSLDSSKTFKVIKE